MEKYIYWINENGIKVGSDPYDFIPLFMGMRISIHGSGTYEVIDWHYHKGHSDEKPGVRVMVRQTSSDELIWPFADEPRPF